MKISNPYQAPEFTEEDNRASEKIPTTSKVLFGVGILLPYFVYFGARISVQDAYTSSSFSSNFNAVLWTSVGFGILLIAISICRLEASMVEKLCLILASIFAMALIAVPLELIYSLVF